MSSTTSKLEELHQHIQTLCRPHPDDVCTGFVIVSEWMRSDGTRYLGQVPHDGATDWTIKGFLKDALDEFIVRRVIGYFGAGPPES